MNGGKSIGVKKAIVFSSLLFADLHLEGAMISQFADGILYCLVYMKTMKLVVPIFLHIFHNGLVYIGLYFSSLSSSTSQEFINLEDTFDLI
ncbi:CPBP family intramembrane metalloprotease [Neobacillus notoginsengisoli]|uniref:CPBP family intramembrane metalloprotease n=1 Tax=Neobacillus notoginsengisoli TaxID=1578198 RepID=A0A417YZM3_9BACI|nr:CPBP family intramembrane metalloprotease [Neobacillus notoginsengisoli]